MRNCCIYVKYLLKLYFDFELLFLGNKNTRCTTTTFKEHREGDDRRSLSSGKYEYPRTTMARCRVEIGKERAGLLGEALVHAEPGWHMMSRPELRQVSRGLGALVYILPCSHSARCQCCAGGCPCEPCCLSCGLVSLSLPSFLDWNR